MSRTIAIPSFMWGSTVTPTLKKVSTDATQVTTSRVRSKSIAIPPLLFEIALPRATRSQPWDSFVGAIHAGFPEPKSSRPRAARLRPSGKAAITERIRHHPPAYNACVLIDASVSPRPRSVGCAFLVPKSPRERSFLVRR
jgi:hypothetical protein